MLQVPVSHEPSHGCDLRFWRWKPCLIFRDALRSPENAQIVESIVNALLKECKKEQVEYKAHALTTLGNVLNDLQVDRFKEVYGIVSDTLNTVSFLLLSIPLRC